MSDIALMRFIQYFRSVGGISTQDDLCMILEARGNVQADSWHLLYK